MNIFLAQWRRDQENREDDGLIGVFNDYFKAVVAVCAEARKATRPDMKFDAEFIGLYPKDRETHLNQVANCKETGMYYTITCLEMNKSVDE